MSRRIRITIVIAVAVAAFGCASQQYSSVTKSRLSVPPAYRPIAPIRTVVIDAGHGGKDPGTSHFGLKEKHLALDIARRLRIELEQAGLRVILTRDSDRFIPLSKRPAVANRIDAGLFVSVHINANTNRRVSGAEVYYPRESVVSSKSQWPPTVLPGEIGVSSQVVKQVLWDLVLGRTRHDSHELAVAVCGTMKAGMKVRCKVKSARFVVLREARMPALLVEVGYVSNKAESKKLNRADYRRGAAKSIARGIVSYIRSLGTQHI